MRYAITAALVASILVPVAASAAPPVRQRINFGISDVHARVQRPYQFTVTAGGPHGAYVRPDRVQAQRPRPVVPAR